MYWYLYTIIKFKLYNLIVYSTQYVLSCRAATSIQNSQPPSPQTPKTASVLQPVTQTINSLTPLPQSPSHNQRTHSGDANDQTSVAVSSKYNNLIKAIHYISYTV